MKKILQKYSIYGAGTLIAVATLFGGSLHAHAAITATLSPVTTGTTTAHVTGTIVATGGSVLNGGDWSVDVGIGGGPTQNFCLTTVTSGASTLPIVCNVSGLVASTTYNFWLNFNAANPVDDTSAGPVSAQTDAVGGTLQEFQPTATAGELQLITGSTSGGFTAGTPVQLPTGLTGGGTLMTNCNAYSNYNVHGWWWSSTIGWIALNCNDYGVPGIPNFGVGQDVTTGAWTGYAWSSNVGWLQFGNIDCGIMGVGTNATHPCNVTKTASGEIMGWAKFVAGDQLNAANPPSDGWDGLVSMSSNNDKDLNVAGVQSIGSASVYHMGVLSLPCPGATTHYKITGSAWGALSVGWIGPYNDPCNTYVDINDQLPQISVDLVGGGSYCPVSGDITLDWNLYAPTGATCTLYKGAGTANPIASETNVQGDGAYLVSMPTGADTYHVDCTYQGQDFSDSETVNALLSTDPACTSPTTTATATTGPGLCDGPNPPLSCSPYVYSLDNGLCVEDSPTKQITWNTNLVSECRITDGNGTVIFDNLPANGHHDITAPGNYVVECLENGTLSNWITSANNLSSSGSHTFQDCSVNGFSFTASAAVVCPNHTATVNWNVGNALSGGCTATNFTQTPFQSGSAVVNPGTYELSCNYGVQPTPLHDSVTILEYASCTPGFPPIQPGSKPKVREF